MKFFSIYLFLRVRKGYAEERLLKKEAKGEEHKGGEGRYDTDADAKDDDDEDEDDVDNDCDCAFGLQ